MVARNKREYELLSVLSGHRNEVISFKSVNWEDTLLEDLEPLLCPSS